MPAYSQPKLQPSKRQLGKYIKNSTTQHRKYIICSDSLSVITTINSLNALHRTSPIILQIRKNIIELESEGYVIQLLWIPAHIGISGNEQADYHAKRAILDESAKRIDKIPASDMFTYGKEYIRNKWVESWKRYREQHNSTYTRITAELSNKPWFKKLKLSREQISIIIRLKTGHCSSKQHLFRLGIIDNDICECKQDTESADHIIFSCQLNRFKENRKILENKLDKMKSPRPRSIQNLLATNSIEIFKIIVEFLVKSKKLL